MKRELGLQELIWDRAQKTLEFKTRVPCGKSTTFFQVNRFGHFRNIVELYGKVPPAAPGAAPGPGAPRGIPGHPPGHPRAPPGHPPGIRGHPGPPFQEDPLYIQTPDQPHSGRYVNRDIDNTVPDDAPVPMLQLNAR